MEEVSIIEREVMGNKNFEIRISDCEFDSRRGVNPDMSGLGGKVSGRWEYEE